MSSFVPTNGLPPAVAIAVTIVAAALGGALFELIGLPAAWLSGSLVAVTALALAGFPAHVPDALRRIVFLILGISMGSAVTPESIAGIHTWPITMAFLVLSIPGAMGAVVLYLRWAGWDEESALYASAPGAMSSVLALAHAAGVDVRMVAFVQSVRIFLLIVALPALLAWSGLAAPQGAVTVVPLIASGAPNEIALMAAAGLAAGLLADRLGVPGGLIVGSMAASAVLHGTGYVTARVPLAVQVPCFVLLGAFIGGRFVGTDFALLRRLLVHSIGAFVVAVVVTLLFAFAAAIISGEGFGKTILGLAPGALEAMIILAFLIGLDPAFVGAHHIVRFLLIALFLPVVARLLFRRPAQDS
jgi:hypothetical protein